MPTLNNRPLPKGRSEFSLLRDKNEIYVDKTKLIYELCRNNSKIFLSRPRRFGKSLLVSTFESLFKYGLKDFHGLDIEELWNDKTYSVLHLDFSLINRFTDIKDFQQKFDVMLRTAAAQTGIKVPNASSNPFLNFSSLLSNQPISSIVLLIDEYDAPLTATLDKPELFDEVQSCLTDVYAAIKSFEGRLRFFFMTGITKLSNTGIFSSFNNLTDISMDRHYGTILGYTEEELHDYFADYTEYAAHTLNLSTTDLFSQLRSNYNGFCFDEDAETHVYCPWSVLSFLDAPHRGFNNYWYESGGQPAVLKKYLKGHELDNPNKFNTPIPLELSELSAPRNYDDLSLEVLLTQAGYLTIKEKISPIHVLIGYPNQEVFLSMGRLYAEELLRSEKNLKAEIAFWSFLLREESIEKIVSAFNLVLTAIDYSRYPVQDEASCRSHLQMLLIGAGLRPSIEQHSAHGRSDLEVDAGSRRWVFELKFAEKEADAPRLLAQAVKQMQTKHYGESLDALHGQTIVRVALVFCAEARRFVAWQLVP